MKRFLRWITGMLVFLATTSQVTDMFNTEHDWFYTILFSLIYLVSFFIGLNLIYKSLK